MSTTLDITTESDILARVLSSEVAALPREVASAILTWRLPQRDAERLQELADRNTEGELTPAEQRELESYVRVGQFLSVMQAQARLAVQTPDRRA